jgi:hypothetical protein
MEKRQQQQQWQGVQVPNVVASYLFGCRHFYLSSGGRETRIWSAICSGAKQEYSQRFVVERGEGPEGGRLFTWLNMSYVIIVNYGWNDGVASRLFSQDSCSCRLQTFAIKACLDWLLDEYRINIYRQVAAVHEHVWRTVCSVCATGARVARPVPCNS